MLEMDYTPPQNPSNNELGSPNRLNSTSLGAISSTLVRTWLDSLALLGATSLAQLPERSV